MIADPTVSQILREQYHIEVQAGGKVNCPFCHHHSFSIKRDGTLAKCFHGSCGRFLTIHGAGASDTIALSTVFAEIYYDFHQGVPGATEHKTTLSPLLCKTSSRNYRPVFYGWARGSGGLDQHNPYGDLSAPQRAMAPLITSQREDGSAI